jgi:hypothetical protein
MNGFAKIGLLNFFFIYTSAFANDSAAVCTGKYDKDSLKHGVWVCRKDNHLTLKEKYKHGVLLYYIKFNEKGAIVETRNRKGKINKRNPCGC